MARDVDRNMQFLVVFPLPPDFDEDRLANEMKRLELVKVDRPKDEQHKLKSTAPSVDGAGYGARQGSLHRVFLMRDAATRANFRYGFAEFWTHADTASALKKFQMTRSFEIAGNVVTIAMIHMGVFVQEDRELSPDIEFMSFNPLFNPEVRIRYRDIELYPSAKIVAAEAPVDPNAKEAKPEKVEPVRVKKRKAEGSAVDALPKKTIAMAPTMEFWQRRHDEIRGIDTEKSEPQNGTDDSGRPSGPVKFSMALPSKAGAATKAQSAAAKSEPAPTVTPAEPQEVSYLYHARLSCLLCMMQYKSAEDLEIHERSGRHKRAAEDESKVTAALSRVALLNEREQQQAQQQGGTQYRDRAKERREAFSQPDKPLAKLGKAKDKPDAKPVKDEAKKAAESKGAGMLAKMGWAQGEGLGAQGSGPTQALSANAYREGVGLGAEGGKLGDAHEVAESRTKDSYASYVAAAQDKARERYKQMDS